MTGSLQNHRIKVLCGVLLLLAASLHGTEAAIPAPPMNLQYAVNAVDCDTAMTAEITVSWECPPSNADANIISFLVSFDGGIPVDVNGTNDSLVIDDVALNTLHNVTVAANNSFGASDPAPLSFTLETREPYPPMNLALELGCGEPLGPITVTWTSPPPNNDLLCPVNPTANVEYTVNGGTPMPSNPPPGTTDTITVSPGILIGSMYRVKVSLENAEGPSTEASASVATDRFSTTGFPRGQNCIQVSLNRQCAEPQNFRVQVSYGPGNNFTAFQSSPVPFNSSNQVCVPIDLAAGTVSYIVTLLLGGASVDTSEPTTELLGCTRVGLTDGSHVRVNPDLPSYNINQEVTHSCDGSVRRRKGPRRRTCIAREWDPPLSEEVSCPTAEWFIAVMVIMSIVILAILIWVCCCIICIKESIEVACCCCIYSWKLTKVTYKFCRCWICCCCKCFRKACETEDEERGARGRKEDVVGARQTGEVAHHEMKTEGVELQGYSEKKEPF